MHALPEIWKWSSLPTCLVLGEIHHHPGLCHPHRVFQKVPTLFEILFQNRMVFTMVPPRFTLRAGFGVRATIADHVHLQLIGSHRFHQGRRFLRLPWRDSILQSEQSRTNDTKVATKALKVLDEGIGIGHLKEAFFQYLQECNGEDNTFMQLHGVSSWVSSWSPRGEDISFS